MVSLNALAITRDQSKVNVPNRWGMLWRKLKKEKKSLLFDFSTRAQQMHVPYGENICICRKWVQFAVL
ncbi:hypothetical protein Pyn_36490 [Prunus yedoensis var. nudiflora]|uniref:Uncharacterized protein n=1 Tax=Prunus yedoensis var. nudiflora TaxID=2094558 RepID=A0A314XJ33_PRUYE|nr:hypothetical protein Pyn_36490 [Prunus yedoensis var. nudiflora]